MKCPGCRYFTEEREFEGMGGARILLDVCHHCHGLWFDKAERLRLSPAGVLSLFRELHGREPRARARSSESMACPRCASALARTYDIARNNRFHDFRCPQGHGHFISFFQFLREKGIVRTLTFRELGELKQRVASVRCSQCAETVDLASHSECAQCQTPVSMLDASGVESILKKRNVLAAAPLPLGVDVLPRGSGGSSTGVNVAVDLVEAGFELLIEGLFSN